MLARVRMRELIVIQGSDLFQKKQNWKLYSEIIRLPKFFLADWLLIIVWVLLLMMLLQKVFNHSLSKMPLDQ